MHMAFIQVLEMSTTNIDEIRALEKEFRAATEGKRTVRRSIICQDRNDPKRHVVLAFFDSYESAMKNSDLPETAEFAKKTNALVDGGIQFRDLDVIEEQE
jgi:hypothetical protein